MYLYGFVLIFIIIFIIGTIYYFFIYNLNKDFHEYFVNPMPNSLLGIIENNISEDTTQFIEKMKTDFNLVYQYNNKEELKTLEDALNSENSISFYNLFRFIKIDDSVNMLHKNIDNKLFNNITIAYVQKYITDNDKNDVQDYYDKKLSSKKMSIQDSIINIFSSFTNQIKNKYKDILSFEDFKKKITKQEKDIYNMHLNNILNTYIYDDLEQSSNPFNKLFGFKYTYKTYIENVRSESNTMKYKDKYQFLIEKINDKLSSKLIFNDNIAFIKNAFLNTHQLYISNFESIIVFNTIYFLLKNENKCFIQNYGEINAKMRQCQVYFIKEKNMCDLFEDLYKLSPLQLEFLLTKNPNIRRPRNLYPNRSIYIYNNDFMNVINNYHKQFFIDVSNNVKIHTYLLNMFVISLELYTGITIPNKKKPSSDIINTINEIVYDIFNLETTYKGKKYKCLDIFRIQQQVKNNNVQICKVRLSELKEIDVVENNIIHDRKTPNSINPSELFGTCFYELTPNSTENDRNNIINIYSQKYKINNFCDSNLKNIKCTNCTNSTFVGFDTKNLMYTKENVILNTRININDNLLFMRVCLLSKNNDIHRISFSIDFVKFNNNTKEFYRIDDKKYVNTVLIENLFKITNNNYEYILTNTHSKKNIYCCAFFNSALFEYSNIVIDFSLNDLFTLYNYGKQLSIKSIELSDIIKKKNNEVSNCSNNSINFNSSKNCYNRIINDMNHSYINNINNMIGNHENTINDLNDKIRNINNTLNSLNIQKRLRCGKNTFGYFINNGYKRIKNDFQQKKYNIDRELNGLYNHLRYWERYSPYTIFDGIHRIRMINNARDDIRNKTSDKNKLDNSIRFLEILIRNYESVCNSFDSQIHYHEQNKSRLEMNLGFAKGTLNYYKKYKERRINNPKYQSIDIVQIENEIDLVSKLSVRNINFNNTLIYDKIINNKFGDYLLLSNDNCIYIQLN